MLNQGGRSSHEEAANEGDQILNFIVKNPSPSETMFSKTGKALDIKFLHSSISIASMIQGSRTTPANLLPAKPDVLIRKKRQRPVIQRKQHFPSVGYYKVKFTEIDPHLRKIEFKKPKLKKQKRKVLQKQEFHQLQGFKQSSDSLSNTWSSSLKQTCMVDMRHAVDRARASRLSQLQQLKCINNPHDARFQSQPQPRNWSNYHQVKVPNLSKSLGRFEMAKRMPPDNFSFQVNLDFVRPINGKNIPRFTPQPDRIIQNSAFESSVISELDSSYPSLLKYGSFYKGQPRDKYPRSPIPSFMQKQIGSRMSLFQIGHHSLHENNYSNGRFQSLCSDFPSLYG